MEINELIGKTFVSVEQKGVEEIIFTEADGTKYIQYHDQDCCECVLIEEVHGDLSDLVGAPIAQAEEVISQNETPDGFPAVEYPDSYTWTFYKLATIKGYVTIRWLGESNGYYSESVYMRKEAA